MSGISFLTDQKGKQTAVQINLGTHRKLWEDFYDAWLIEERKNEARIPWQKAKSLLKKSSRGVTK